VTGLLTYDFSSKKSEDVYYKILAVQGSSLLDLSHCLMYNISVYWYLLTRWKRQ